MPTESDTEENYYVPWDNTENEAGYVKITDEEWSEASHFLSPREMKVWKLRGM